MTENPRQFNSLDYANADLYGAVLDRPSSAVPLNLPLENYADKPPSQNADPLEKAFWRESENRMRQEFKQQREAQLAREQALAQQEQERNLRLQQIPSKSPEPPTVSDRNYERQYEKLPTSSPEAAKPTNAAPPPTPKGTAARASALVEPTQTPAPALLKEALPITGAATGGVLQKALPRSLPTAAGRLVAPGVVAGVDLANRVLSGQPVGQALAGTAGSLIGGGVGLAIGSFLGGPIGGYVGSAVGGMVGGRIADMFFQEQLPSPGFTPLEAPNYPPYRGGNGFGKWSARFSDDPSGFNIHGSSSRTLANDGAVVGTKFLGWYTYDAGNGLTYGEVRYEITYLDINLVEHKQVVYSNNNQVAFNGKQTATQPYLVSLETPDWIPSQTTDPQGYTTPPPDGRPPYYNDPPLNRDNTIPSGVPSNGTKGKVNEIAPSKLSGGNPRGEGNDWIPSGFLAPGINPNPHTTPSNLGGMLPQQAPAPMPKPYADPENEVVPRIGVSSTPSSGGVVTPTLSQVGYAEGTDGQGNYISPKGDVYSPDGKLLATRDANGNLNTTPTATPNTSRANPIPDAVSPVQKSNSSPINKTPEQSSNEDILKEMERQRQEFDEQIKRLSDLALLIGGIGTAVTQIPNALNNNPGFRQGRREDIQNTVCDISQPGACLGSQIQQATNAANQNGTRLDAINTALNTGNLGANAQLLAGQATILERLGPQIPGGLSSKLERLAKWLHLDRVLNILIWWQTLHNAYMLSANLGQTLTSAISNVLAAIGIEDAEGSPLDIGAILGGQFDSLAKTVIGESEWGGIKAEFKKWNRIYQAAANLMNSIQSIGYSILSALEVVGSWVALIGNALRKWGEVGENAYRWMNPTPNFQNKFFTTLETTENVISQVDQVASEVLSIQETVTQIGEQKEQFTKALSEEPQSKQGNLPPEATQVKAGFDASKLASVTGLAITDEDKEADE